LLKLWLKVFENWYLRVGFRWLIEIMNEYMGYVPTQIHTFVNNLFLNSLLEFRLGKIGSAIAKG
jgi:hypothetical protein